MYVHALHHCGEFLLALSDEEIGTYIFEEFDIEATTYLHHNTLDQLKNAALIDENEYDLSTELRRRFMELQGTALWNVESVKTAAKWLEIMRLADNIKASVVAKHKCSATN